MIEPVDSNIAKLVASRNNEKKDEIKSDNKEISVIHSAQFASSKVCRRMVCGITTDGDDVIVTIPDDGTIDHLETDLIFPKKEVLKVLGALYTNK